MSRKKLPIQRNRRGLYFDHFENKVDAENWFYKIARSYKHHPDRISIERLSRTVRREGIKISPTTLSKLLQYIGVKVRSAKHDVVRFRDAKTFTFDKNFAEYMTGFDNQSRIAELGARVITGYPTQDLVMFLPSDDDMNTTIIFMDTGDGMTAQVSGKISHRDEILIRSLISKSKVLGVSYIVKFCEEHGFNYYGGNIDFLKPPEKDSTRHEPPAEQELPDDYHTKQDKRG